MSPGAAKDETVELWPADYLSVNRLAYDRLAEEYCARREADRPRDLLLIKPFVRLLREHFPQRPIRVIDIGCGAGLNLQMFQDERFDTTGIDVAPRMIEAARELAPTAHLILGDFLSDSLTPGKFEGVFAKAVIHLLPRVHARQFLVKAREKLVDGGVFYATTTMNSTSRSGLTEKDDYAGGVRRYRHFWTKDDLLDEVTAAGFKVLEVGENHEPTRGKSWFNVWAERSRTLVPAGAK